LGDIFLNREITLFEAFKASLRMFLVIHREAVIIHGVEELVESPPLDVRGNLARVPIIRLL
jgi:hypothetical protein